MIPIMLVGKPLVQKYINRREVIVSTYYLNVPNYIFTRVFYSMHVSI